MIWVLLLAVARADDAHLLSAWSTTAVEATPDLDGGAWGRVRQRVGLEVAAAEDWRIEADGAVRHPAGGADAVVVDVHRLALDGHGRAGRLAVGRMVRLDARGWLPLDGVAVDLTGTPYVAPSAWAGRLWSPEPEADPVSTWVGGLGVLVRPPAGEGRASRAVSLGASWMGRLAEGELGHSATTGLAVRGPRGASGVFDAEVGMGAVAGSRASLRATLPVGAFAVGPELRWEGLAPTGQVTALRTPMDWLSGQGYGVAGVAGRWAHGGWSAQASGGAVARPDADGPGGLGRAAVGWGAGEGPRAGVFGAAAGLGGSWVAGGGVEAGLAAAALDVSVEAGAFRFQPLDGASADVLEARLRAGVPLVPVHRPSGVRLGVEAGAGADRLLERWARAGLVLDGRFGAPEGG